MDCTRLTVRSATVALVSPFRRIHAFRVSSATRWPSPALSSRPEPLSRPRPLPCLLVAQLLSFALRLFARFLSPRQAYRQEGAASALPAGGGEVLVGQRVGVRPVERVVRSKRTESCAGVLQGLLDPVRLDELVVLGAVARVHRGDHRVAGPSSELPVGVERCLGH